MNLLEYDLEGRKAVLVGASRGIGKGVALVLAQVGVEVAIASLNIDSARLRWTRSTQRVARPPHSPLMPPDYRTWSGWRRRCSNLSAPLDKYSLTDLIGTIGYFCYIAVAMNAFETDTRPDLEPTLPF